MNCKELRPKSAQVEKKCRFKYMRSSIPLPGHGLVKFESLSDFTQNIYIPTLKSIKQRPQSAFLRINPRANQALGRLKMHKNAASSITFNSNVLKNSENTISIYNAMPSIPIMKPEKTAIQQTLTWEKEKNCYANKSSQ